MQAYAHAAMTSTAASAAAPAATSAPSATQDRVDQDAVIGGETTAPVALRFVGATAAGDYLVCTPSDQQSGAVAGDADSSSTAVRGHFLLPVDERVRAAILKGSGSTAEWESPMTPQLRPKEIQNRIRAGASVEQVAAAAGCAVERIEGFAYPVLLERATVAERARATFPLRGAPLGSVSAANAGLTLEEIAAKTLTDRGQHHDLVWDAFKDERGWTVTLTWTVGRTENRAEWAYVAQPSGGTITARNAEAADLLEPSRSPLREVGGLSREMRQGAEPEMTAPAADTVDAAGVIEAPAEAPADEVSAVPAETPVTTPTAPAAQAQPARRGHRPPMPSWEDVLLGTRGSQAGGRQ